jgi:hypothetical protein
MKLMPLAGLAALIVAGAGSAALARGQPDPNNYPPSAYPPNSYAPNGYAPDSQGAWQNPNVQADRNYQDQRNAYDNQADAAAQAHDQYNQQRDSYDQNASAYRADRRDYKRRLHEYERARADYDALYGPGAYEHYYPAPVEPPD